MHKFFHHKKHEYIVMIPLVVVIVNVQYVVEQWNVMSLEILDYIARTPLQDMVQNIIAMTTHTKYMTDFKKQQNRLLLFYVLRITIKVEKCVCKTKFRFWDKKVEFKNSLYVFSLLLFDINLLWNDKNILTFNSFGSIIQLER